LNPWVENFATSERTFKTILTTATSPEDKWLLVGLLYNMTQSCILTIALKTKVKTS